MSHLHTSSMCTNKCTTGNLSLISFLVSIASVIGLVAVLSQFQQAEQAHKRAVVKLEDSVKLLRQEVINNHVISKQAYFLVDQVQSRLNALDEQDEYVRLAERIINNNLALNANTSPAQELSRTQTNESGNYNTISRSSFPSLVGREFPRTIDDKSSLFQQAYRTPSSYRIQPYIAENGSYYGQLNQNGVPKTVRVRGYFRRDGTYVQGHYRSAPGTNP